MVAAASPVKRLTAAAAYDNCYKEITPPRDNIFQLSAPGVIGLGGPAITGQRWVAPLPLNLAGVISLLMRPNP
jgi:hypothetical protein